VPDNGDDLERVEGWASARSRHRYSATHFELAPRDNG
jgi:hypothetical protein